MGGYGRGYAKEKAGSVSNSRTLDSGEDERFGVGTYVCFVELKRAL